MLVHELIVFVVQGIHSFFFIVQTTVDEPEDPTGDETSTGQTSVEPDELWIDRDWRQSTTDGGTEGVGQQEDGHDEGFHRFWGLGVSVL